MIDWNDYKNFSKEEFDCKETGENQMRKEFMDKLQECRTAMGKPFIITSGFRSVKHSVERSKKMAGEHTFGLAADISGDRLFLLELIMVAYCVGFRRIGINLSGGFVHLGWGDNGAGFPAVPWDYSK